MRDSPEAGLAHIEAVLEHGELANYCMGGFWILEAADLDEALAWAKKAAVACDVPGEVRQLLFYPAPEQEPGGSR
jgi:hypothetical protein